MNAHTLLPLAMVTALLSLGTASAVDTGSLPDNEAQAKARASLYADDTPAAAPTEAAPVTEPVAAAQATDTAFTTVSTDGPQPDSEAQAKARAALRDEAELATTTAAVAVEPMQETAPEPTKVSRDDNPLTSGMAPPSLPTDQAQQQQLSALLDQYRADQISASEYHGQRASILAGK